MPKLFKNYPPLTGMCNFPEADNEEELRQFCDVFQSKSSQISSQDS